MNSASRAITTQEGRVLPFRRPPAQVRFRRKNPWVVMALGFLQAICLVGAPLLFVGWLLFSPTFALASIEVNGIVRLPREEVLALEQAFRGENLWLLDLKQVADRILDSSWVESARVEKLPPAKIRIEVQEREPIALLQVAPRAVWIDRQGRRLGPCQPGEENNARVKVEPLSKLPADLAELGPILEELEQAAPDWAAQPLHIGLVGEGDYRLRVRGLEPELWLRAGTLRERVIDLRRWLPELARRYGKLERIDVRFARRIIVEPGQPRAVQGPAAFPEEG